jgi:hypothetical protein
MAPFGQATLLKQRIALLHWNGREKGQIRNERAILSIENDPLLKRAEAALAETARLRDAFERLQEQANQRLQQLNEIVAELDPLLSHRRTEIRRPVVLLAYADSQVPEAS